MQEVTRKEKESFENLFRRFNRKVLQSGKLKQSRKGQYFEKPLSRNQRRSEAIRKSKIREARKESYKKAGRK